MVGEAAAEVGVWDNTDLAWFTLGIHPDHRRRGHGSHAVDLAATEVPRTRWPRELPDTLAEEAYAERRPTPWTPGACTARSAPSCVRSGTLYRVVARHRASGQLAGQSIVVVDTDEPAWALQHDTSVVRAHRGHGSGCC